MRILNAIAAAGLLMSTATVATGAQAQDYRGGYDHHDDRDHRGDRGDYQRDEGRHDGWDGGRHRGWTQHRHCRVEWHHHRQVRVCR